MENTAIEAQPASAAERSPPGEGSVGTSNLMNTLDDTYGRLTRLIERLHRRHLDMLRFELVRQGIDGINPVQALMLMRLDGKPVAVRDLIERGYYLGSNVSYNIKQLVKAGYAVQERAPHDRRSLRILVTDEGRNLCARLNEAEAVYARAMGAQEDEMQDLVAACRTLRRLEQLWADQLRQETL